MLPRASLVASTTLRCSTRIGVAAALSFAQVVFQPTANAAPPTGSTASPQPDPERREFKRRHLDRRYPEPFERRMLELLNRDPAWAEFRRHHRLYVGGVVMTPVGGAMLLGGLGWFLYDGFTNESGGPLYVGSAVLMPIGLAMVIAGPILIHRGLRGQRQVLRRLEGQVAGQPLVLHASPGGLTLHF